MSDYCRQCATEMFPPGYQDDMAGLITPQEAEKGLFASVLCECCGYTQVTIDGTCIHHKKQDEGHKHCRCGIK